MPKSISASCSSVRAEMATSAPASQPSSWVASANSGLDLAMPGPVGPWGEVLVLAVGSGEVPLERVDDHGETALMYFNGEFSHAIRKGPLGAHYPRYMFIMEGDTPSFLGLINNGLGSAMSPASSPPPRRRLPGRSPF